VRRAARRWVAGSRILRAGRARVRCGWGSRGLAGRGCGRDGAGGPGRLGDEGLDHYAVAMKDPGGDDFDVN
jgi:hypothetical protein